MWSTRNKIDDDKLDRLSDELFRALEANDTEISTAAEFPVSVPSNALESNPTANP